MYNYIGIKLKLNNCTANVNYCWGESKCYCSLISVDVMLGFLKHQLIITEGTVTLVIVIVGIKLEFLCVKHLLNWTSVLGFIT